MSRKIAKARIGKCYNELADDIRYQLQFKEECKNNYNGFSVDTFETDLEAKEALCKHNNGERVYFPFASLGTMRHYFLCKVSI